MSGIEPLDLPHAKCPGWKIACGKSCSVPFWPGPLHLPPSLALISFRNSEICCSSQLTACLRKPIPPPLRFIQLHPPHFLFLLANIDTSWPLPAQTPSLCQLLFTASLIGLPRPCHFPCYTSYMLSQIMGQQWGWLVTQEGSLKP